MESCGWLPVQVNSWYVLIKFYLALVQTFLLHIRINELEWRRPQETVSINKTPPACLFYYLSRLFLWFLTKSCHWQHQKTRGNWSVHVRVWSIWFIRFSLPEQTFALFLIRVAFPVADLVKVCLTPSWLPCPMSPKFVGLQKIQLSPFC